MRLGILLLAALLIPAACDELPLAANDHEISVAYGTSFGMCVGYCQTQMLVSGTAVTLLERSWDDPRFPPRVRVFDITAAEWERLSALAQAGGLAQVAGVHGCPDCADGGAEFIELKSGSERIRATFEYRHTLAAIAELQTELRALHERLRD